MFKNSFYIKAGRNQFYIRSLKSKNWIKCNSTFEVDESYKVKKISDFDTNISNLTNHWTSKGTISCNPFNHPRVVINDFESLIPFTKTLIKALKQKFEKPDILIFHLDYIPQGDFADIELREIRTFLEFIGGQSVYIVNPEELVDVEKVDSFFDHLTKGKFKRSENDRKLYANKFWH